MTQATATAHDLFAIDRDEQPPASLTASVGARVWQITFLGDPVPKGRPRSRIVRTRDGREFISFYTPKETQDAEAFVREHAALNWRRPPITTPIVLSVLFCRPVPPSWSKRKQREALAGLIAPAGVPDLDNLVKLVTDALNGLVFETDALIVEAHASKQYSSRPRTEIALRWNERNPLQ